LLLSLVVQFGLIAPFIYHGLSFGWLRFFMYPLFVAAGWGLYEVAQSRNRTLAATLVLVSWLITAPVTFWTMADPELGQEESKEVTALLSGKQPEQVGYYNPIEDLKPVAQHLEKEVFPENRRVVVDSFEGWPVATSISPSNLRRLLIVTPDERFKAILENPRSYDVIYFLVPNPDVSSQDAINRRYPKLWAGAQSGFELFERYPAEDQHEWRLYQVVSAGSGELERNKALLSSEANATAPEDTSAGTSAGNPPDRGTAPDVHSKGALGSDGPEGVRHLPNTGGISPALVVSPVAALIVVLGGFIVGYRNKHNTQSKDK
jgi:hypothetical protein